MYFGETQLNASLIPARSPSAVGQDRRWGMRLGGALICAGLAVLRGTHPDIYGKSCWFSLPNLLQ